MTASVTSAAKKRKMRGSSSGSSSAIFAASLHKQRHLLVSGRLRGAKLLQAPQADLRHVKRGIASLRDMISTTGIGRRRALAGRWVGGASEPHHAVKGLSNSRNGLSVVS